MQIENETINYYITIRPLFALRDKTIIDNVWISIRERCLKAHPRWTLGHQPTTSFAI